MYVRSMFNRLIEEENQINIRNHKYIYVVNVLVYSSFFFLFLFSSQSGRKEKRKEKREKNLSVHSLFGGGKVVFEDMQRGS